MLKNPGNDEAAGPADASHKGKRHRHEPAKPAQPGPRLALLKNGHVTVFFPIALRPLTVGREPTNTIVLNDGMASKKHAVISLYEHDVVVEDLGSLNGTRVNERKVKVHTLGPGDLLRIGRSTFLFLTTVKPPKRSRRHPVGWIVGRGPEGGIKVAVMDRPLLIGRAPETDIRLPGRDATDYAAQIVAVPGGVQMTDLATEPPTCTILRDGADLRAGTLSLKYRSDAASEPPKGDAPPAGTPAAEVPASAQAAQQTPPAAAPSPASVAPPRRVNPMAATVSEMPKSDDSLYRALQAEADRLDHEPVPTSQTLSGKTDSYDLDLAKRVGGCVITARSGPLADKTFMLVDRALVIGRNPQCDIRLDDESVLPRHAAILKKEGDPIIDDLDTASVIYLNGDRVRRSPLKPGDVIRIGVSEFLVHL